MTEALRAISANAAPRTHSAQQCLKRRLDQKCGTWADRAATAAGCGTAAIAEITIGDLMRR